MIYDVLKRGKEIGRHEDHDKRGKRTITFGAPVVLNGTRGILAVVVNMRSNHFYAERIVLPDGSAFVLTEKKNTPQDLLRGVVQKDSLAKATSGGSISNIRDSAEKSNTKLQERDYLPDDRELLLNEATGAKAGEELVKYRKKVKSLEALERKLTRQKEALKVAKSIEKQEIKAAIQKTEASIVRAQDALARMEATPTMQRAAENARAAWREANPNEAAQVMRLLRQENESLKQVTEYWRKQAKLTEPGEEQMLPEDIRALSRTLIQEHGSDAAEKIITERLVEVMHIPTQPPDEHKENE